MNNILQQIIKRHNLNSLKDAKPYTAGQINEVFELGDVVIKIEKDLDIIAHQPPLIDLAYKAGAKIPKLIVSGKIGGKSYIVMKKIKGTKLSEKWHTFNDEEKENYIIQIINQLRIFHSIKFDTYSIKGPGLFKNFEECINTLTTSLTNFENINRSKLNKKTLDNLEIIEKFYNKNLSIIEETNTAVLVHNDLHFDNILFIDDKITGIVDFDFTLQASKDYELWRIFDFFTFPVYYVEERLESIWRKFEVSTEIYLFKKHYPELFDNKQLLTRLKLYFINQSLCDLNDGAINKFNEKINQYFKTNWLENALTKDNLS